MNLFETAKAVPIMDIIHRYGVQTKEEGRRVYCTCPNPSHPDLHPSALVNTEGKYPNTFNCFSCGAHGSTVDFVMLLFNLKTAKESAQKIVDDFCNGKYDKESRYDVRKIAKERLEEEKTQYIASAYKSIWNAKYKQLNDLKNAENIRIDTLEAIGKELSEEESKNYVDFVSEIQKDFMQIDCIVRQIESLEEQRNFDRLARFLFAIRNDTDKIYDELLNNDLESGTNYVRGIQYAK